MRGNFSNFANTTLAQTPPATGIGPSDTSFTVASGGGNAFPIVSTTTPYTPDFFIVAIDEELVLCSGRTGDTFTVAQRGYEGTTAISHTNGAPVTLSITAGEITRVWKSLADAYNPDVPPWYRGGPNPSAYDDEFEQGTGNIASQGNWVFSPQDAGQIHSFGLNYPSFFDFHRARTSYGTYFLYQPLTQAGAFTITAKMSHGATVSQGSIAYHTSLFVADSANPSTSLEGGNRARVDSIYVATGVTLKVPGFSSQAVQVHAVRGGVDRSGVFSPMTTASTGNTSLTLHQGQLYYSLSYDGSGTWDAYVGDGYTYTIVVYATSLAFTPRSFGFRFFVTTTSDVPIEHVLIDWVRIVPTDRGMYNTLIS